MDSPYGLAALSTIVLSSVDTPRDRNIALRASIMVSTVAMSSQSG